MVAIVVTMQALVLASHILSGGNLTMAWGLATWLSLAI